MCFHFGVSCLDVFGSDARVNGSHGSEVVYGAAGGAHLIHGCQVSDDQIQAWADEAEAGYDLRQLPQPVTGLPPSDLGTADRQVPAGAEQATLRGGRQAERKINSADLT